MYLLNYLCCCFILFYSGNDGSFKHICQVCFRAQKSAGNLWFVITHEVLCAVQLSSGFEEQCSDFFRTMRVDVNKFAHSEVTVIKHFIFM